MKAAKESDILKQCLQWLRLKGCFAWRNNSTGIFDPSKRIFRSFSGMKGVSDILGVLPGGRFLAVETKGPDGKLSPDQAHFLATVTELGGLAIVARSIEDLEAPLTEALK